MEPEQREILYFENFDLDSIVTPVDFENFDKLLANANYCRLFLYEGFKNGFSLGYQSKCKVMVTSRNLKLRVGDKIDLWNKVMKEVKLKRYAGPFSKIPFDYNYIQSPIGLVPKDNVKETRLIFHLSYPRAKVGRSSTLVNANTPQELCKVKYPDFSDAIRRCLEEGDFCHLAKSDQRSTFRNLGILKRHWRYLIMKTESPIDGLTYFFVDKCLPFGTSISCSHFQKVSDAIAYLVEHKTSKKLTNYLDDYLFTALLHSLCNRQVRVFLEICEQIKMPISPEKTEWATTMITFLGFLIDTFNRIIGVPQEKISKAINMLEHVLSKQDKPAAKRKMTILQLQKICGFLNFLSCAVIPGRAFT